jgi:MoaA/NifB/PqqE/SkfB family radical SAM enzyme
MHFKSIVRYGLIKVNQIAWRLAIGYKYIPYVATIELTSRCNAHCVYCGRDGMPFVGDMPIELFKKLIDAMPFVKEVGAYAVGESTLHPNFVEAIKYAADKGKDVVVFTNGSTLTPEYSQQILDAGIYKLVFSIDVDNKKDYEAIRPPLKWDRLVDNVDTFVKLRGTKYKTKVVVRMTETPQNRDRVDEIMNFWRKHVDAVNFMNVRHFYINLKDQKGSETKIDCMRINNEIVIRSDGTVIMCCDDWYNEYEENMMKNKEKKDKTLFSILFESLIYKK